MIYLTGDVHTQMKGNWEQDKGGSEIKAAKEYLEILKKNKISSTLFINGICIGKDLLGVKELLDYDVELGGHTYDNFGKMNIFKSYLYRKRWNCIYGPDSYQKKDIIKTKKAFERLGIEMKSWRTHAFGSNPATFKILKENRVKYISDFVGEIKPFEREGVIHIPVNIPIDQNTIAYGEFTPENKNPFASCVKSRIKPEEWLEIVKKRIIQNEKEDIPSVLLIHPITMKILDNFKIFEELARFLAKYKNEKISEFCI